MAGPGLNAFSILRDGHLVLAYPEAIHVDVVLRIFAPLWVEAEAKKVYMQTVAGEKLLVRHTLKQLESRLKPHHFARVHKSYLVNLDYVAEVMPWFSGTYIIRMADEARTQIPMSRRYAAQLKKLTGWR